MASNVAISMSASGQVIAAPGDGKRIKVLGYVVVATTAVTVRFDSGTTPLTGAMPFGANGGAAPAVDGVGWFECAENEALNITLGSGVAIGGHVRYTVEGV